MRDPEIFEGKKLSDLLQDIHNTTLNKREQINGVISILSKSIKDADSAVIIAPLVKDFFDVSVKNDDQLVKIATIIQRMVSADSYKNAPGAGDPSEILSEKERDQLLKAVMQESNDIDDEIQNIKQKAGLA